MSHSNSTHQTLVRELLRRSPGEDRGQTHALGATRFLPGRLAHPRPVSARRAHRPVAALLRRPGRLGSAPERSLAGLCQSVLPLGRWSSSTATATASWAWSRRIWTAWPRTATSPTMKRCRWSTPTTPTAGTSLIHAKSSWPICVSTWKPPSSAECAACVPPSAATCPCCISDMLEGYTLEETCERHGWTRNRGVTLMRKLRTVFYEEMTGEKKTGYLGSHHPLTEAEKQRIRELYATGLSYRKVGALVGRSASAVESVCKQYPPELVAQVRELHRQGLSNAQIARRIGRGRSTSTGWSRPREPTGRANGMEKTSPRCWSPCDGW